MADHGFATPAAHPLETLYYVFDGQSTIGPLKGTAIKILVQNGSLKPDVDINVVGEDGWTSLSQSALLSYVAPRHSVPTTAAIGDGDFAGFWPRLFAYLIDSIFVYILSAMVGFVFGFAVALSLAHQADKETIGNIARVGGSILGLIVGITYFATFLAGRWQATPGKRILGIYVIRADRGRVSWWLGLGRYFGYILSSLTLGIGFLMIFWTQEKRALHDYVCGTRVVRGKVG